MENLLDRVCGMDVHKETVVVCIMGEGIKKEIRTFSTMTNDLIRLKQWLKENMITHVAMESTGVYWKPIYNILEDSFEIFLVNARHIKHVPGRKTDMKDCEWICKLLRNGLLKGSFIPPKDIRELRDLTRYKRKLIQTISAEKNRIQKILEDANIKISSVVSDTFGATGYGIINAIIEGTLSPEDLSTHAKGRLKKKKEELKEALTGNISQHHIFMIKASLDHIHSIEKIINELDKEIDEKLKPYQKEYELLKTIPGVKDEAAECIIAEIGVDMDRFPDETHLASWAGLAPGNNESAGKKKICKTTYGDKFLETVLTQCAWAATRSKNTYLNSKYYSLLVRRGKKKALIAIAHKIIIACYFILKHKVQYKDLGPSYLNKKRINKKVRHHLKQLEGLGYIVTLEQAA